MDNSKKIQFGLLGLVALLLILNMTGAFKGLFGGDGDDVKKAARENITSVTGDVSPSAAAGADAAAVDVPAGPTTAVEWTDKEFDYGVVEQGEKVTHLYTFKNVGDEPLIISNAKGSCGCTVPQWPKDPVLPGESGEIKVQWRSSYRHSASAN